MIFPEYHTGWGNGYLTNAGGHEGRHIYSEIPSPVFAFAGSSSPGIPEARPPEIFINHNLTGDMNATPKSISSTSGKRSPSSFGSMNYHENIHTPELSFYMSVDSVGEYYNNAERTPQEPQVAVQGINDPSQYNLSLSLQPERDVEPYFDDNLGLRWAEQNLTELQLKDVKLQQMQLESQNMPQSLLIESTSNSYHVSGRSTYSSGSDHDQGQTLLSGGQQCLLVHLHAQACLGQQTECQFPGCNSMKKILDHLSRCDGFQCGNYCLQFWQLFQHYQQCSDTHCSLCIPVRIKTCQLRSINDFKNSDYNITTGMDGAGVSVRKVATFGTHIGVDLQNHPRKYMKLEQPSVSNVCKIETSYQVPKSTVDDTALSSKGHLQACQQMKTLVNPRGVVVAHEVEQHAGFFGEISARSAMSIELPFEQQPDDKSIAQEERTSQCNEENIPFPINADKVELGMSCKDSILSATNATVSERGQEMTKGASIVDPFIQEEGTSQCNEENILVPNDCHKVELGITWKDGMLSAACATITEPGQQVAKGASLIDSFTPQQIMEHMRSLSQSGKQDKQKDNLTNKTPCDLCGMVQLSFDPPPRYCSECKRPIERGAAYYFKTTFDTVYRGDLCIRCCKGDLKEYTKSKNIGPEEKWVQCDKCNSWQHQICALFNEKRNQSGQAEYTCPKCLLQENESGKSVSLPRNAVLGAKELPPTLLSNHIEKWLFRRLKQEREERAKALGKNFHEVPGAEDLVVRVVSSINKTLKVEKVFHEMFREGDYPSEFNYKSKAICLFQKIEGADVCLFVMYVQEFGSDCAYPNRRRVCLSYIDSVKYFTPDIKAVTGEALRTFVYHEILVGYLDYCKKRGYTSLNIWVCPPVKGDDYVLYCHPKMQKTPKAKKLREWYLSVIHKAEDASIVVDHDNLYEQFFVPNGESKAKITATQLPYFDGDYWPGKADELLKHYDGSVLHNQGKNAVYERTLRAARRVDSQGNPKDILLMRQLGDSIRPMKEDFIMIHLQYACNHCRQYILSGSRWVCNVCKKFQLCNMCYDIERSSDEECRHPADNKKKHSFCMVEVGNIPAVTDDKDDDLQSNFFDAREDLLKLSQRNQYQFDSLRRAKHSTMMLLYHLHNPTVPEIISSCTVYHNIELSLGRHHKTGDHSVICQSCFDEEGAIRRELVSHTSLDDHDAQKNRATEKKLIPKEPGLSDIVLHASRCFVSGCDFKFCRKIRWLFHHSNECRTRTDGGCRLCKKIGYILKWHTETCKLEDCYVPWCRDLKHHMAKRDLKSEDNQMARVKLKKRKRSKSSEDGG